MKQVALRHEPVPVFGYERGYGYRPAQVLPYPTCSLGRHRIKEILSTVSIRATYTRMQQPWQDAWQDTIKFHLYRVDMEFVTQLSRIRLLAFPVYRMSDFFCLRASGSV